MSEPVLKVWCNEPGERVERSIYPTRLDFDKLRFLIDKISQFDVLFNDHVRGDWRAIVSHFISLDESTGDVHAAGLMWDVDDVGMFLLNELKPGESAHAHFIFWDRRFNGREQLCREMLKYVMEKYQFHRIVVEVPLYAKFTLEAVDKIGMVLEGRMREATLYKGEWFDVKVFSVLKEDLTRLVKDHEKKLTKMYCPNCLDIHHREFRKSTQKEVV